MIDLSIRLKTIYDMVEPNLTVCDLCSDHGYIPIELLKNNITNKVIATDIKQASIDKIKDNIIKNLSKDKQNHIDIKIGDGLKIINYDEFDVLIISGIGSDLMIDILTDIDKYDYKYLLLSPQTKIHSFRKWIIDKNLYISDEKIVYEDEQYYFIFKITKNINDIKQKYDETEILYSKYLIKNKDKILYNYINKQLIQYEDIINKISQSDTKQIDVLNHYKHIYNITKNIINNW